jgi:hypothetical protein
MAAILEKSRFPPDRKPELAAGLLWFPFSRDPFIEPAKPPGDPGNPFWNPGKPFWKPGNPENPGKPLEYPGYPPEKPFSPSILSPESLEEVPFGGFPPPKPAK